MARSIPGLTIKRHRPASSAPSAGREAKPVPGSGFESNHSGAIREKAYDELREKITAGKKAQRRERFGQTITRFSTNIQAVPDKWQNFGIIARAYTVHELRTAMKLCREQGLAAAVKLTGLSYEMLHTCWKNRRLPATGPFCFKQMVLLVKSARLRWLAGGATAMACLRAEAKARQLSSVRLRRFLSWELIPGIPGFCIYADPEVQLRCEAYARAWPKLTTGAPIFSP